MRFEEKNVCKECFSLKLNCGDAKTCQPIKTKLRSYDGIRLTADGFDCAFPVTIDSHSKCSYECLYCFSDNILGHSTGGSVIGQTSLKRIESIFKDKELQSGSNWEIKKALKYDRRNKDGFPCAVQLGGLCDAGDNIELNQGWLLEFIDLAIKYNQPVRMSTKGGVWLIDEYLNKLKKAPHLFWVAFSMITDDDKIMSLVDRRAANATQRIQSMKRLSDIGVRTSLRLRPIILGITDRNNAYVNLINKCADAGAEAISYEVGFYPSTIPKKNKWKWDMLNKISGYDQKAIYKSFGKMQTCTRPSYLWTENIMHSIKEVAVERGLDVGVSDPVWKQLTNTGCCCGVDDKHEVFGNWEQENATNALLKAKRTGELIYIKDITPEWSKHTKVDKLINPGAGPKASHDRKDTWAIHLKRIWNDPTKQRSVMNYFQGALQIHSKDENGDLVYEYKGLERKHLRNHWKIYNVKT